MLPTLQAAGYFTAHFGKWHIGDSAGYTDSTGAHPAAPSPRHYGIDTSKCYLCNPDTPADIFDTDDPWFPSNSSRLLVDAGVAAIGQATAAGKPFYINLWFHISHAPMLPTPAQCVRQRAAPPS